MASAPTPRLNIERPDYGDGPDGADVVYWLDRITDRLDEVAVGYDQGAELPAAGTAGRLFYRTSDGTLFYDMGTGWVPFKDQPGDVVWTARSETRRLGYLPCDGAVVSRTTYAALFSAVGTVHGAGDGRTTFGVPDARDRAAVAAGTVHRLGEKWGTETVTLAASQVPDLPVTIGGVLLPKTVPVIADSAITYHAQPGYQAVDGVSLRTLTGTADGGGGSHPNTQPSIAFNAWIKV